jgi:hypothetical protein
MASPLAYLARPQGRNFTPLACDVKSRMPYPTLSGRRLGLAVPLAFALGCSSVSPPPGADNDPGAGVGGGQSVGGGSGAPAGGMGASAGRPAGDGGSPGSGGSAGIGPGSALLPARIRRLANAEYDASVQALLGTSMFPSVQFSFPPDSRQGPHNSPAGAAFTVNDAQRVDPVLADKLDTAAQALVAEARQNGKLAALAPCADPAGAGAECAKAFLRSFGGKAFRRPLSDEEVEGLVSPPTSAYHVGADGYSYEEGIDLLTRVLLQSAGFLYVTELGDSGAATITLTPDEIAVQLAYLLTGAPPDDALLQQAAAGALATPEGREAEARRLMATPGGKTRLIRVVKEWLGIDQVARREKAASVYKDFATLAPAMEVESHDFIDEVLHRSTGTLTELLTADWTMADQSIATLYGVPWGGAGQRTSLASVPRRGILNQAAFLSVFATNNGSHPVFRGVALMRRVACLDTEDPGALGIVVSFPAADPSKTTRERFAVHAADPGCAGCHKTIDAFGFAMENFDGIGMEREGGMENGRPVDTSVTLEAGSDIDGTYADSVALLGALSQSDSVKACLARQLFRSSAARSDASVTAAEEAFVALWRDLPPAQRDRLADVLLAFVRSPSFIERRTP